MRDLRDLRNLRDLTPQQIHKTIAAATSSALSMIGSLYILSRYWYVRYRKAKSSTSTSARQVDVTKELIHVLAWLDLVGAIGRVFGSTPIPNVGEPVTPMCHLQAYVIEFGDVAPIAWNFVMALNLYRWVCRGEDQEMLQKKIKWYILATLTFTLTIATVALVAGVYGDATLWCWIAPKNNSWEWKVACLYVWVLAGAVSMSILLILVKIDMKERLKDNDNEEAALAYQGVVTNLTIYIVAFIVCWLPAVLDRGYSAIMKTDQPTLSFFHAAIVPLQGFVNAVIYGKFHVWIQRKMHLSHQSGKNGNGRHEKSVELSQQFGNHSSKEKFKQIGTATIFVTTFDMNWSVCPPNLEDWIPPNKDLYVFSLQHCIGVQSVEDQIRKYLGKINFPSTFQSVLSMSGIKSHSSQDTPICELIFVNSADVTSGNFVFHEVDGKMWNQKNACKEVVGIPVRYFDATIAFVSCNLSSSDQGNSSSSSTDNSIEAKHYLASSLILSFGMNVDRADVDFPYLYHHTFLSGNLNYDIDLPFPALCTNLEQAYKAECLKRGTDLAMDAKLDALTVQPRNRSQPPPLSASRLDLLNHKGAIEPSAPVFSAERLRSSSMNQDQVYKELYSNQDGDNEVPFVIVQSPRSALESPKNTAAATSGYYSTWESFLEAILPSGLVTPRTRNGLERFSSGGSLIPSPAASNGVPSRNSSVRGESKKISDLMEKSRLASENTEKKWQELIRYDQLRAAMEAKEVFCGFEEPPVTFLPSFPRKVGTSASYFTLARKKCRELFEEPDNQDGLLTSSAHGSSVGTTPPAYKDRILVHSLPDTRPRLRNVKYWLCEEILTSTHKPVCSVYEVDIDRFYAFKNKEADMSDFKQGIHALKDKHDMEEYRVQLVNLDANIWTYQPRHQQSQNPLLRRMMGGSGGYGSGSGSGCSGSGAGDTSTRGSLHTGDSSRGGVNELSALSGGSSVESNSVSERSPRSKRSTRDVASFLSSVGRRKDHHDRRISRLSSTASPMMSPADLASGGLQTLNMELVPVDPLSISTVFPLPSEDVVALQRKMYEVAHAVNNGFQAASSGNDNGQEEAELAYTNFRTVSWQEAAKHGVKHSAITRAVNGVLHIAIKITAEKGHGGQGILCIREQDILSHLVQSRPSGSTADIDGDEISSLSSSCASSSPEPIPFDVMLTWGGKHVGYLHGDILVTF